MYIFSYAVLLLGAISGHFSELLLFLCLGVATPPPFSRPLSGPLAWAQLTSTSSLGAKPSPRQLQPDWQGLEVWRGGPGLVVRPLIGLCWSHTSAENLTRSRGQGLPAEARELQRTKTEKSSRHVHSGLVASPGVGGCVGTLSHARAAPRLSRRAQRGVVR